MDMAPFVNWFGEPKQDGFAIPIAFVIPFITSVQTGVPAAIAKLPTMICDGALSETCPVQPGSGKAKVASLAKRRPLGSVSVKASPPTAGALGELVSVNISAVVSLSTMRTSENLLVNDGSAMPTNRHCGFTAFAILASPLMDDASFVKAGEFNAPHCAGLNKPD